MTPAPMNRKVLWLLTGTTVFAVGNIYYSQPLLGEISETFGLAASAAGTIPMMSQLGYVAGLLFITPLGDVLEKRSLLVTLLVMASLSLAAAGLAPNFPLFLMSCLIIGLTAVLVQIIIPFVAVLSAPEDRGRNLGAIISAALVGVLLSRTLSGLLGGHWGWRGMYFAVSGMLMVLAGLMRFYLPRYESSTKLSYPRLIQTLYFLFRDIPKLRAIAITGALIYASLSIFWASLAFYLKDEFQGGPEAAGLFGLVGAAGALSANLVGRFAERIGVRRIITLCIFLMLTAWGIFAGIGGTWLGMILGVLILDIGAQSATVSNQTDLYRLHPEAQTRLNTVYKMFYFCGGASGSALSALAWDHFAWRGVCGLGAGILLLAFGWERHWRHASRYG